MYHERLQDWLLQIIISKSEIAVALGAKYKCGKYETRVLNGNQYSFVKVKNVAMLNDKPFLCNKNAVLDVNPFYSVEIAQAGVLLILTK